MVNLLKQQYDLVCSARAVELSFLKKFTEEQLLTPVLEFNNKTIIYFAVHINQVYIHWIGKFALDLDIAYIDEENIQSIAQLNELFDKTNQLMEKFCDTFAHNWSIEIDKNLSDKKIKTSPLKLFTHVITHEFHHKGQMMTMARILGKTPPDTDVIRT
ncbi:DinB family protein [Pedobacter frigiditerrae]|uniref:DinB family protein n=1 Tax=Pedobacter frigiditerrae TaxID=2530452 RepID=UPI002931AB5E|nr:DinB family protein [Pedobacter frigiditerrae]